MALPGSRYDLNGKACRLYFLMALILSNCEGDHHIAESNQGPGEMHWQFPLEHPHEGILMGNGELGVMVWGRGNTLKITLGKSDFWDHQDGHPLAQRYHYDSLLRHWEAGTINQVYDELRRQREEMKPGVLPLGRLELILDRRLSLVSGILDLATGTVRLVCDHPEGEHGIEILVGQEHPLVLLDLGKVISDSIRALASWEFPEAIKGWRKAEPGLRTRDIPRPEYFSTAFLSGWMQERPEDPPVCVTYAKKAGLMAVALAEREDPGQARQQAGALVSQALRDGADPLRKQASAYWAPYWERRAEIRVPDSLVQLLYDYGMYKFGAATRPGKPALTLQGPWIEACRMPPWLSDYHFNINVEMMYWQAFKGNQTGSLLPLFRMLETNLPQYQANARIFLGIEDGIKITHAMDDRGNRLIPLLNGGYMDPGSSAWPALMMHRYFEYTLDTVFLAQTAVPFMKMAFNAYHAMLRKDGTGTFLIANSPEFYTGSAGSGGIGRNPSFQLVILRSLTEKLMQGTVILGEEADSRWGAVLAELPRSVVSEGSIAIWEGQPYRCHRHFSHLAGIYPFDHYPEDDPYWNEVVRNSYEQWIREGRDCWAGWSYPWAVAIHSRFGNAAACLELIREWAVLYMNEGYGTLHDRVGREPVRMQLDAGFGMSAAILEMLAYEKQGTIHLFQGIPGDWQGVGFENMLLSGRLLISADNDRKEIRLNSGSDRKIRLAIPWEGRVRLGGSGSASRQEGKLWEIALEADQELQLTVH